MDRKKYAFVKYHSPNVGAVFVVAHHVIHELTLHEEQLAADFAGVLAGQKHPVGRRHVPYPVLGGDAAQVAHKLRPVFHSLLVGNLVGMKVSEMIPHSGRVPSAEGQHGFTMIAGRLGLVLVKTKVLPHLRVVLRSPLLLLHEQFPAKVCRSWLTFPSPGFQLGGVATFEVLQQGRCAPSTECE